MSSADLTSPPVLRRRGFVDHSLFGMGVFVFTEIMLFSAFISAFLIVRHSAVPGSWPPADQPRLPFESTAFNTVALLASGVFTFWAQRALRRDGIAAMRLPLSLALLLGMLFVGLQGMEWAGLLRQGLTPQSSQIGGFFYLIIGCHALHVVISLGLLAWCWLSAMSGRLPASRFGAAQLFWYFVVLVWPFLWLVVYR